LNHAFLHEGVVIAGAAEYDSRMDELERWMGRAAEIAAEAGGLLMEGWRRAPSVRKKGAIDLVTDYDLRAEALLRERLAEAFAGHAVVAEEGESTGAEGEWVWYVDPLDGTTNFAHGHFFFAVSLGLARRGEPVLGVVHAPALATTWCGAVGLGCTRNGAPCGVSREASVLVESLIATGFPYDRATSPENNVREASAIIPRVQGIRRCGSAALDLALVADGTYDGYWEQKLKPWDACAGIALVRAAGGVVTDYAGRAASADTSRLVATNVRLHPVLLEAVREARAAGALPE
jgi:myo-inositol-1(or 4)-monophosphatase